MKTNNTFMKIDKDESRVKVSILTRPPWSNSCQFNESNLVLLEQYYKVFIEIEEHEVIGLDED